MLKHSYEAIKTPFTLNTTLGFFSNVLYACKYCSIDFDDHQFPADPIILDMIYFDVILGMD